MNVRIDARPRYTAGTRRALVVLGIVMSLACATLAHAAPAARPRAAARLTLGARLRAAGRAECAFTRVATDAFSGKPLTTRGRLTLETPDRSRLEFPATGERITLRGDGGEWLQPKLRQLVVFGPERASGARRWWQLLIDGAAPGIDVTPRGARTLLMRSSDGAGPDSARLELDGAGLPVKLVVPDGEADVEYRFARWSFGPARGAAAFRQSAPSEYERVDMK
jgi:hypothetical protein